MCTQFDAYIKKEIKSIHKHQIQIHQGYFVKEKIIEEELFEQELALRELLPTYIPTEEEIEDYGKFPYVVPSIELGYLMEFLKEKYWYSEGKCTKQAHNILMFCRSAREFEGIHDHLYNSPLKFESEEEALELTSLIVDLAYQTRVQEFNGYKPSELLNKNGRFPQKLRKAIKKEFPVYAEMLGILSEKELAEAGERVYE